MTPPAPTGAAVILDGSADPAAVGGKAAALDRLVSWGLPVPPAAAATTTAYRNLVAHPDLDALIAGISAGDTPSADEVDAAFAAVDFDPADADAIVAAARAVAGGGPVAVRSSATVEDMAQSSFAGQYTSVLNVDTGDADAVCTAVRDVFASLWHPAPVAYRAAFGVDASGAAMAALIQRMVPAVRAGVAFTRDPTGDPSVARVEWVDGLAESLVSGKRTPTVVLVDRPDTDGSEPVPDPGADADEVAGCALALAMVAEHRAASAQDVEWAWDGAQVWLVQARPITTVGDDATGDGFDDPPEVTAGADLTTAAIGETLPGVLAPLVWTTTGNLVDEAFRTLLASLGLAHHDDGRHRLLVRRVRGRAALDAGALVAAASSVPGAGAALQAAYFGTGHNDGTGQPDRPRRTLGDRVRSVGHDLAVVATRRRAVADAECAVAATDALATTGPDPASLDTATLARLHLRLVDLAGRLMAAELGVAADAAAVEGRWRAALTRHLRHAADPAGTASSLTRGFAAAYGVTTPPTPQACMAVVAGPTWDEAGITPPVRQTDDADTGGRDAAVDRYLIDVLTASGWDPGSPLTGWRLRTVRRQAIDAVGHLALRERTKAAVLELGGHLRRVHLDAGRRLTDAGVLDTPADVDLLTAGELRQALGALANGDNPAVVAPDQVARRRRWLARYAQQPGLPARFTGGDDLGDTAVADPSATRIEGWAASPGRYTGDTVVVHSADADLPVGAVLVAEATDPSWSPLFMRAGAIVLDRGGPLSHAAILARELGVPAVMNVTGATTVLAGTTVTVDGDNGVVMVHDPTSADGSGNDGSGNDGTPP